MSENVLNVRLTNVNYSWARYNTKKMKDWYKHKRKKRDVRSLTQTTLKYSRISVSPRNIAFHSDCIGMIVAKNNFPLF